MPLFEIFLSAITIILNTYLGLFTFLRNPKSWTHRLFLLLTSLISFYVVINYLSLFPPLGTPENQLFWIRAVMAICSLIGPTLFILVHTFPKEKVKMRRIFLGLLAVMGTTSLIASLLPFVFTSIEYPGGQPTPTPGPAMPLFFLVFVGMFIFSIILLILKYRKTKGLEKVQHFYFLLGIIVTFSMMGLTTVVFTVVLKFTGAVFLGPTSSIFLIAFLTYAIVKHRFLDIRLVLARTVSYLLLTLIIIFFYASTLFAVGSWIFPLTMDSYQLLFSIILSLIVAYSFQPLRRLLEKITDRIFFKENYTPEEILGKLSFTQASTIELEELTKRILELILKTMHLDGGGLLLLKDHGVERIIGYDWNDRKFALSKEQYEMLFSSNDPLIVFDDLEESDLKEIMRETKIGCFIQLKAKNSLVGILALGEKLSGEIYTSKDLKVLEIWAPQLAMAIQNAKQYEEIQQFSKKLEAKVKAATQEIQIANTKLKELDKLKDEFLSVAAHELRAPMTAIKGYLSMILEGDAGEINDTVEEYLKQGVEGNDRLIRLVNNMLNVARIEEGRLVYQMGTVSLKKVVETVFSDFKAEAENKKLEFGLEMASDLKDQVYVNQDRIHEVVANLISNAIKYTDKGSVVVKLIQPSQQKIRFEVVDTGEGISEKEQEKLFQKFFRAESTTGKKVGTGLGLYISKLLIEKFEGEIDCQSELGKGSTFWFELSLKKET